MHVISKNKNTKYSAVIIIISLIISFLILHFTINKLHWKSDFFEQSALKSPKYILRWNYFWSKNLCDGAFEKCPISSCVITANKSFMEIEDFDAIIFHDPWSIGESVPEKRKNFQKYIFYTLESPIMYGYFYIDNFYNWTMTYRKDSDIYLPFGILRPKLGPELLLRGLSITPQKLRRKSKLVAWIQNHCRTSSVYDRVLLLQDFTREIPVDIYGACGRFNCPKNPLECLRKLDKEYKFYLSIELSLCKNYITERFFYVLKYTNMIPIVLGSLDYSRNFPNHSYINIEDFKSPQELHEYLKYLDKNDEKFLEYFKWRKDYVVETGLETEACCELCKKLHEPITYGTYENFEKWALGENGMNCFQIVDTEYF